MESIIDLADVSSAFAETPEVFNPSVVKIEELRASYGSKQVLKGLSMEIPQNQISAFIGPSGCGKSTALRCINRMNDLIKGFSMQGVVTVGGQDITSSNVNVNVLRKTVGMVFQHPNPFPMSIRDNIGLALREHEPELSKAQVNARVREALEQSSLWDEVSDDMDASALSLSGGQQQRLCIARALAIRPAVLMLDEPCASLDPISTAAIERLLLELKSDYTIVIVTHNLAQARRISDKCAFFLMGELVEWGDTERVFSAPQHEETAHYLSGVYG